MRWVAAVALATLLHACAFRPPARQPTTVPARPPTASTLRVRSGRGVERVATEDYVAGCVAAELGSIDADPPSAARARDVQAILCRSFALASIGRHRDEGFDLCATTHCQVYRPLPATVIGRLAREATTRTTGLVLLVEGRPVLPVYHADCGGHTSGPEDVWGGTGVSFLGGARDEACLRRPAWRLEVWLARLEDILAEDPHTAVNGPLRGVAIERHDAAGRAAFVRLDARPPRVVRGADFRTALLRALGPTSLRSTLFAVSRRGNALVFEGHGNGHGVGLCQAGAIARAARGDQPAAILAHYFPGATVGSR